MKKRINISLDEDTADAIKVVADRSHKNVSQWITDKVWAEFTPMNTGSSFLTAYNENGNLANFSVNYGIVECPQCQRKYKQRTEEQVPGFRDKDYDRCPYCGSINKTSMEVEFFNSKLDE